MIKVKNEIVNEGGKDPLAEVLLDDLMLCELRKLGVEFVENDGYDFCFAMANPLRDEPEKMKPRTIAFERIDGPQIRNKELLFEDNLCRLVKMYKYAELEPNNLPCVDGRVFTGFLEPDESKYQPVKMRISQKELDKVVTGLSFLHYKRHDECEEFCQGRPIYNQRPIDLYFGGTTQYGTDDHASGKLITEHRNSCIDEIWELQRKGVVTDIYTSNTRTFNYPEYLKLLYNTKIVISPWGWGESCYRDYEAMMCGCWVIKPRSFDIESFPHIYNMDCLMTYCLPDWSDLEEAVNTALTVHLNNRIFIHEVLISLRSPQKKAERIFEILKGAMDG